MVPKSRLDITALVALLVGVYWVSAPHTIQDGQGAGWLLVAKAHIVTDTFSNWLFSIALAVVSMKAAPAALLGRALLLNGVLTCLAAVLFFAALRRLAKSDLAAFFVTTMVFFSASIWKQAVNVSPVPLAMVLGAATLWLLAASARPDSHANESVPGRNLAAYGAGVGVLVALYTLCFVPLIFMVPLVFTAVYARLAALPSGTRSRSAILIACGLAPGLLLPLGLAWLSSRGSEAASNAMFLDAMFHLKFNIPESVDLWPERYRLLTLFWRHICNSTSLAIPVLAAVGVLSVWASPSKVEIFAKRACFGVIAALLASAVGMLLLMEIAFESSEILAAEETFFIPVFVLAAAAALGFAWLERELNWQHLTPAVIALLAGHLASQWPAAQRANHVFFEADLRNAFAGVAGPATIAVVNRHEFLGLLYGQEILGLAGGEKVVTYAPSWENQGNRSRIAERLGVPAETVTGSWAQAVQAANTVRPLFMTTMSTETMGLANRVYQSGRLIRLLREDEAQPSLAQLYALNLQLFGSLYSLPYPDERLSRMEMVVYSRYLSGRQIISDLGREHGSPELTPLLKSRSTH